MGCITDHKSRVTGESGHTPHTQCWVRIGYYSIGRTRERQAHNYKKKFWVIPNFVQIYSRVTHARTQIGTESHLPTSSWYHTAVGPGWGEGVVILPTIQSDELGSIPKNVESISSSQQSTIAQYYTPIRISPLSQ